MHNLLLGVINVTGGMNKIGDTEPFTVGVVKTNMRIVATDGARRSAFGLGGAYHFADLHHGINTVKYDSDERPFLTHGKGDIHGHVNTRRHHFAENLVSVR